jgi:superfamily II DNA/RNA helicase
MIADQIYNLISFKRQYKAILALSVSQTIQNLQWATEEEKLIEQINWNNILGVASILSHSDNSDHLEASLRIAQTCLTNETSLIQKSGAVVILETLTNMPAIKLAVKRELIGEDYEDSLPVPFKLLSNKVKIQNSVIVDSKVVSLNRFQKKVYDASKENITLSISAPTSAGKSYILYQLLLEELTNTRKTIIYIVPTRALISQVEEDLRILIDTNELQNINLTSVPHQELPDSNTNLYVFTQERLHWHLMQPTNSVIDLLIIDEAHKIDNGNRGILLQRKLEDVVELNPNVKIFFSSPFTSNPEILLDGLNYSQTTEIINTEFVAVNQNLLYVTQVERNPKLWQIDLILKADKISVGTVNLVDRPTTEAKKIAFLADAISTSEGGSLIFSNGPAEAEKYAKILVDLIPEKSDSKGIKELIKLVKTTIHKDYSLASVLQKGVAYHYGNMPLLVRQEIERLFKENEIRYLICTSTLLEGVNLPATAVFVRKPTRGKGNPLNENDFWNLAGRAGRWGKEFSGNIVCIQPEKWEIKPSPTKRKQKIERALDTIKLRRGKELLKFVQDGSPRLVAESDQDLEFAFSYYYSRYRQDKLIVESDFERDLIKEFRTLQDKIKIPDSIIFRNPGISPIAQEELYTYFQTKKEDLESLIPVYPEDENAYEEYVKLVGRIGKTLASFPPQLNNFRALLLINWMSGKPLSYLISGSYNNYQSKGSNKKIDTVCRETMDSVENFARFRFAKESSCYIDILRFFLNELNRQDLLDKIPDLNLWLEFGVSQTTQLSLLGIGLSRNTVITISEYIARTDLTKEDAMNWLIEADIEAISLSPIMIVDIQKAIRNKKTTDNNA